MSQTLNEIYQMLVCIFAIIGVITVLSFVLVFFVACREAKLFGNDPKTLNPDDQYTYDRMNQNEYES